MGEFLHRKLQLPDVNNNIENVLKLVYPNQKHYSYTPLLCAMAEHSASTQRTHKISNIIHGLE